jgi:hypothetical protein
MTFENPSTDNRSIQSADDAAPSLFNQPREHPQWTTPQPPTEATAARMADLMRELAYVAGADGVIMSDARLEAQRRRWLTNEEAGRSLSWLGGIAKRAGLINSGRVRRSSIPRSRGNYHVIWLHPDVAEASVEGAA